MIDRTARSYAQHLASYMSDVSTIRVRVREMFDGGIPSRQAIQNMVDMRKSAVTRRQRP